MLERIKLSMRVSNNVLDSDILMNMDACSLDLRRVGINKELDADSLMYKAAELYCKWQMDHDGKAEQYKIAYGDLRNALSLCGDYNAQ